MDYSCCTILLWRKWSPSALGFKGYHWTRREIATCQPYRPWYRATTGKSARRPHMLGKRSKLCAFLIWPLRSSTVKNLSIHSTVRACWCSPHQGWTKLSCSRLYQPSSNSQWTVCHPPWEVTKQLLHERSEEWTILEEHDDRQCLEGRNRYGKLEKIDMVLGLF